MITLPEYKVMGGDGQEYDQIHAEQIRQWFAEGRLENKTPVIPPDAKDWVFLESLPEFADLFQPPVSPSKPNPSAWPLKIALIAAVLLAGLGWVLWKQFIHHH